MNNRCEWCDGAQGTIYARSAATASPLWVCGRCADAVERDGWTLHTFAEVWGVADDEIIAS